MKRFTSLILFAALLAQAACLVRDEKEFQYLVPEQYEYYVNSFIAAAEARGRSIKIDNLIILEAELEPQYCGMCNSRSLKNDVQKIITLRLHACWQNDQQLECLIFHELGHCILGRVHDESELPNGDKKSIMTSDDITLYSPCEYNIGGGVNCDKTVRREYYIDELFNPNTAVPDWGK